MVQGGFTITSPPWVPQSFSVGRHGYLELAIQRAPRSAPAAWLWQSARDILGSPLKVRVGGNFVWPPPRILPEHVQRLVLVAGGVGIK